MKFFVTCGSGLIPFFKEEINDKFREVIVPDCVQILGEGKVMFELEVLKNLNLNHENDEKSNANIDEGFKIVSSLIENIKTAERLFGFVLHESIDPKLNLKTRRGLLSHYFQVASKCDLHNMLEYWARVKLTLKPQEITENADATLPEKRAKLSETENFDNQSTMSTIGFRICSRLQQSSSFLTHTQEVSKTIGTAIVKGMCNKGWRIKLRHPDLEVMVNINDTEILIGIPLTSKPLSERIYLTHIPLRSTVSYCMGSLLFKEKSENCPLIILDPMCGAATILVEIVVNFSKDIGLVYGLDQDADQLLKAKENIEKAKQENTLCLIQGECSSVVFQFKFDCIICDLPFGKQHGTVDEMKTNLPKYLQSFDVNLTRNGKIVLLISENLVNFLLGVVHKYLNWTLKDKYNIKEGVLLSVICLFEKVG